MNGKWGRIIVAIMVAVSLLAAGNAFAGADDLAKQADKTIRDAERKMFSGDNAEADRLLKEAAALIDQGKAEDPNNSRIMSVDKKFDRVRKAVDKKLGNSGTASSSSSGPALPAKPQSKVLPSGSSASGSTVKTAAEAALPGGVKKRLRDITRSLDQAERYVDRDAGNAAYKLKEAAELFDEIGTMYKGQFDPAHPDFASVQTRYDDLTARVGEQAAAETKAKADAAGSKAAMESQSAEWVSRFRGYLSYPGQEGHNPDTLVFVPGTSEPEKFEDARKRYDAFKQVYEEYRKTDFPNGKTWALEDLADREAPLRLKDVEEGFASRVSSIAEVAESDIDSAMRQLERETGWKSDKTLKPNLLDHKWMTSISEKTRQVSTALGESDPRNKNIQAQFNALVEKDREHRRIRMERTFMTPDRYSGSDIAELKKKAESLVQKDTKEGGTPLRSTIISENWKEETVDEWTDTTKTTWRRRTTRSMTAQVAARTSDGVRLITVALAQDKQSNGGWGPLYGNLHQYSDPMLEENVNR